MHKLELVWHAGYRINPTNPVDEPLTDTAWSTSTVHNPNHPPVVSDFELQETCRDWIAEGMDVERNRIEFTYFVWSDLPYVEGSGMPPRPRS